MSKSKKGDKVKSIHIRFYIECLEKEIVPWRMPYNRVGGHYNINAVKADGSPFKLYSGSNRIVAACYNALYEVSDPRFITSREIAKRGGNKPNWDKETKKYEIEPLRVIYPLMKSWNEDWLKSLKAEGKPCPCGCDTNNHQHYTKYFAGLRFHCVWNVQTAIENFNLEVDPLPEVETREIETIPECEKVVEGFINPPTISHNGNPPSYQRSTDTVSMPTQETFRNDTDYYATLFHELAHATGHPDRLHREREVAAHYFGSKEYGREELVAEMTAGFLCNRTGIEHATMEQHGAYCKSWIKVFKKSEYAAMIYDSANDAEKAEAHILNQ